jgi:GTP-binding protein
MKVVATFMKSAADAVHFPEPQAPEVAFLGRSNVGKSSLLNSLIGDKLARVSNTPGRTQTINFFAVNFGKAAAEPEVIFADLPGYGYARVPKAIVGEWPKFIEPYLHQRGPLALCVVLVDSNIPPQKSDLQLIDWLKKAERQFLVVATKTDKLSGNSLNKSLAALRKEFEVNLLPYSAKTGKGKDELWKTIREATAQM